MNKVAGCLRGRIRPLRLIESGFIPGKLAYVTPQLFGACVPCGFLVIAAHRRSISFRRYGEEMMPLICSRKLAALATDALSDADSAIPATRALERPPSSA